jgi:XTP/dITP diphosphohydrolase
VKLYCATGNPGKLREYMRTVEIELLPNLSRIPETGRTFEENAILKALHYGPQAPGLLFADDSGLEVDALGGQPGVRSSRFAGENATDEENNRLLLEKLQGLEDRTARFVCAIALAEGSELMGSFRGEVEGRILEEPRGANGFGYDPLFFYPPFGCSFGELPANRKLEVSHRGKAIAAMLCFLRRATDG